MDFFKKHELWLLIINVILFLAITSVQSQINKIIFFVIFLVNNILIYLVQKIIQINRFHFNGLKEKF
ncbi:hypothetical protein CYK68_10075 [Clostridium perfringens]|nr:hypothetical protein CYK68_10075 [Clostridium perfringens]